MNGIINVLIASRFEEDQKRILTELPEDMGFRIAGIEKDESGAVIRAERLKPDVLILDFQLLSSAGLVLIHMIRRRSPSTAIIILCDKDEEEYSRYALNAGVSGFLLKNEDINKLAPSVKIAFLGGCYINNSITEKFFNEPRIKNQFLEQDNSVFSSLERNIITLMTQGYSDTQISNFLNCSEGSIKNSFIAIKRKIKLKSRVQIAIYWIASGLARLDNLGFDFPNFNIASGEKEK